MTFQELQEGNILLLDKPIDWTSFDVVNKIKWKIKREFKQSKIKLGHAGTLDPKATGLLVVCTGRFTKKIPQIQDAPKEYQARLKIGAQTDTYDTESSEIFPRDYSSITDEFVHQVLSTFVGLIEQRPPLFSALKIGGKRAYQIARSGGEVEIPLRTVNIFFIRDVEISLPFVSFTVGCSKGTYVRSLAHDIGQKLGVGAYLYSLRRTRIGNYSSEQACSEFLKEEFRFQEFCASSSVSCLGLGSILLPAEKY